MKRIIEQIREEKEVLARGAFFQWLAAVEPNDRDKLQFIPGMYAYVLAFRDLLNLIEGPEDNRLQSAVNAYVGEDASHYEWYLQDLAKIGAPPVQPLALYDRRLLPARRAIYRMIGYALEHDAVMLRVILVMIFEATGEVFLRHTRQLVTRLGLDDTLGYFGTRHYEDELAHTIQMDELAQETLSEPHYALAQKMVADAFAEYRGLFQAWKDYALAPQTVDLFDGRRLTAAP